MIPYLKSKHPNEKEIILLYLKSNQNGQIFQTLGYMPRSDYTINCIREQFIAEELQEKENTK